MDLSSKLAEFNPWWKPDCDLEKQPGYELTRRFVFVKLLEYYQQTKFVLILKGMRQLGKSTLLKQLIYTLIEDQQVDSKSIFYFEFSRLQTDLAGLLKLLPESATIFLDEIQFCTHWREIIKVEYDNFPGHRFVITGSSNLGFHTAKESLLGRFFPIEVNPLTFREYLHLKYQGVPAPLHANLNEWQEYVQFGEFPEILHLPLRSQKWEYLKKSILEPLQTADVTLYQVEKIVEFEAFLTALAANIAQELNKSALASELGISRPSINKYLGVVADIGLVTLLPNYHRSVRQRNLSNKKVLFKSLNLALALLDINTWSEFSLSDFRGHVIENAIANNLTGFNYDNVYYWRRKKKELDLVISNNGQLQAWEIKSKTKLAKQEVAMYQRWGKEVGSDKTNLVYLGESNPKEGVYHPTNF